MASLHVGEEGQRLVWQAVHVLGQHLKEVQLGHAVVMVNGQESVCLSVSLPVDDDAMPLSAREGQPGAMVMVNGQKSTRENKLLSWASEIEALVAVQRDDLRRARMELAAAGEVRILCIAAK
jgi:hypothetical protein